MTFKLIKVLETSSKIFDDEAITKIEKLKKTKNISDATKERNVDPSMFHSFIENEEKCVECNKKYDKLNKD